MKSPNLKYKSTFFNFLISLFNFFHSLYFFLYFKFVDLNFVFVSKQISNSYIKWIHFNRYWALFLIFVFNVEKIRFFIISIQNLNTHLNYSLKLNKNSLNNRRNIIKLHSFSPFTFLFAFQQIFFYEYLSLQWYN